MPAAGGVAALVAGRMFPGVGTASVGLHLDSQSSFADGRETKALCGLNYWMSMLELIALFFLFRENSSPILPDCRQKDIHLFYGL